MLDQPPNNLVTEIPEAPKEIGLSQALGLVPLLAGKTTEKSYTDRLRIHDPVIRVYALTELIKSGYVGSFNNDVLAIALYVARESSFLRQQLIPMLINVHRFDLVDTIISLEHQVAEQQQQLPEQLMVSQKSNDFERQVLLLEKLYLQTGDPLQLNEASNVARSHLPWQKAWKHILRMFFVQEEFVDINLLSALQLFELEEARDEFRILARLVCTREPNKIACLYATVQIQFWEKNYQKCLELLDASGVLETSVAGTPIFFNLAARSAEKLEDYHQAAGWYEKQNKASVNDKYVPAEYIQSLDERAALPIIQLPEDTHNHYIMMTGFPRSGTTLLENALSGHPQIATCEETASLAGTLRTAYTAPMENDPERKNLNLRANFHRDLYYQNLDRWVTKTGARIIIDKTPILSANIKYIDKLFPNKRFIFSIRHPYDVVLSNWKQTYSQNPAMSSFNDFHDACILYNYVMSNWFEVFPGETDRVYYVRYDDLVNDFQRVVKGALAFLGVEWADEVMNFVEHSAERSARTPSYTQVRKGLTIGVQTSWENFEFLFDDRCRELLDPWVNHFGYDQ